MIDNLTINFEREDIAHTLNVPTRDENLPEDTHFFLCDGHL